MGKIRYRCTTCSDGFTTLSAARRHLKNREKGAGMVVKEVDFLTGRFVPATPGKRPEYKAQQPNMLSIAGEEYHKGFWRRLGELDAEEAHREGKKKDLRDLIAIYQIQQMRKLLYEK